MTISITTTRFGSYCVLGFQVLTPRYTVRKMIHSKCRGEFYATGRVPRFAVPDDKVDWSVPFHEYSPIDFTSPSAMNKPLTDPVDIKEMKPNWYSSPEKNVQRSSYHGDYKFDEEGRPLNPFGRTGIKGRGILYRWGPNHAADPIVTRWKKNGSQSVLQFVAIQRRDCLEWAIPGGMVDPGEKWSTTLMREFLEEALNACNQSQVDQVKELFDSGGKCIYKGYVDDPRNTDNAWMETVAAHFHDEKGLFDSISLEAGDDAKLARWKDISKDLNLYASHKDFIYKVALSMNAPW